MTPAVVQDLRDVITLGLARGDDLLTAGEHRVARRIAALDGPPAVLFARLTTRVPTVFRVEDLTVPDVSDAADAVSRLAAEGLADGLVRPVDRASQLTIPTLKKALAGLGLSRTGRKADLVSRLAEHHGWWDGTWFRVRHRALIRRLERWAFLRPWPDRSILVVARMGVIRWPKYRTTSGTALFPTRRALLRWEEVLQGPHDPESVLEALSDGSGRAPGRLDVTRALRRILREHARDLERDGLNTEAAALYRRIVEEGGERAGRVAFRWARSLEASGSPRRALEILERGRTNATDHERIAIARAGRRLARSLRRSFAPERPLRQARTRSIRLPRAPDEARGPRWQTASGTAPVEAAVCEWLRGLGRRTLHGEGRPWSTLFALLFAETYFLPVPGALPVQFLAGPLDLGTPRFRSQRRDAIDRILAAIAAGEAPDRIRAGYARWNGLRLAGARWDTTDVDTLAALARGIGPRGLSAILTPMLSRGRRAAAGLPDLAILPGEDVRLPGAHPSRLPGGLVLAEVKGPTDSVRDAQAVWLDRLTRADVAVELWEVAPPP